jgi:gliding motility-associated-like protein
MQNINIFQKLSKSVSTLLYLAFFTQNYHAQENNMQQMTGRDHNFSQLSPTSSKSSHPYWRKFNSSFYQNHPEFATLPFDTPCENCVEDLSKRTRNERYFIDIKDTFVFYQQTGYGDLHYWDGQYWLSIDHRLKYDNIKGYHSYYFANPIQFKSNNRVVEMEHGSIKLAFNDWKLFKSIDSSLEFLSEANWSNLSAGDDGIFIKNIFPGIDCEMIVTRGAVKTNFIINDVSAFGQFDELIFRDQFTFSDNSLVSTKFNNFPQQKEGIGSFTVFSGNEAVVEYGEGVSYLKNDLQKNHLNLQYRLGNNFVDIVVPQSWIMDNISNHPVVIDPIVTGSNTLAQASILGSMYNATCNFTNSCNYNLTVAAPANAIFQNVTANFNYSATGACWLMDGAMRFTVGSCVSPNQAGFYWFCNAIGGGTCTGSNVAIYNDISSCLPAPACVTQNVTFTLQFFRSCYGTAGCNNTCIGAASPFSVTITGRTLEYSNTANPITVSSTTICQGQSINASTTGLYGVSPYTYTWSFSPTGLPTIATGQNVNITFPTAGSITLYSVVTDACGNQIIASRIITVTPGVTPTFAAQGPYCSGAVIPALPTSSLNGISGTWSPAVNNTATTTYTFTPNAGQCAAPTTMTITITPANTPTFAAVGPYCSGATIPALPTTSQNGITGTWSPAINNTTTTTYTFTPTAGQCANTTTLTITITPNTTPTFAAVGPFCSGATIPALPTTSQNGITGTWSPAINNSATTTYTFTPTPGLCATTATLSITINPNITPTFASVGPYCAGAAIPPFLTTSQNGITGTWSPAINNSTTTTYTFTPNAGQCATTTTRTVTITPNVTPTFAAVGPFCSGATIPALPTTSQNGILGNWSPAINNTTTTTYTFNPNAGQCATSTTLSITITPQTPAPAVLCYQTAAWNPSTCSWTISGTPPNVPAMDLGPDLTICQGQSVTLSAPAGYNSYSWSTGSTAQSISVNQTGTYTVSGTVLIPTSTNLVTNPGFNSGNTGFTSSYTVGTGGPWGPVSNGNTYAIVTNPNAAHIHNANCPYQGNMLVANGGNAGNNANVWCQTIAIQPNTNYIFSVDAINPHNNAGWGVLPLTLNLVINGTNVGSLTPPMSPNNCNWQTYSSSIWNSGSLTSVTICVQNATPVASLLAIDNLSFSPVLTCTYTDAVNVTVVPNITPTFAAVGPFCSGATIPALPTTSLNGITGTWSPAINNTATTTYTFTPTPGQCAIATTMTITINPNITPTFAAVGPFCSGATIPNLPTTSQNGFTGTWSPAINNTATTTYTFTPTAGQCATTTTLTITINPNITPTFAAVGPFCSGATIPALPTTSQNGFTGTWSPAINNTATTTYTFTPTAGQCATTATLTITINPNITPTFAAVGPFCSGATIPALPTTSQNGFTGTWSPAINNTATTTYTFTPTAGQCATTATLTITINANITPTFAAVGPFCSGATIPALPTTSQNGFTGIWSPAINNSATTTYTFTPTPGQCAIATTMTITINPNITPTFAAVGPFCSGATIPALLTTSQNGFTGTWSPAINNTATTTYTFTPTAGQCATTASLTITINPNITPTFAAVGPFCSGATIPALPTTSQNGFTGTWSPAINNTATTTYTFTPTAGQCATTTTLTITINPNITPTFAAVGPFCSGATIPALSTTSQNGFTGTWSPAINNTATTTYTFTPTAGQCATTATLTITINSNITPTFAAVGPFCSGATIPALPTTSQNGFTGTWSPAINNIATTTYTFTPTAGQCATTASLTITINPNITPTFAAFGPFCSGATIPDLPTTSQNGFTGTWSPGINNTATTSYTFTPTSGQCATTATLTITINPNITPTFAAVGPFCSGAPIPALPTTSQNGFTGTWSPAINNTATTTYTFTPSVGQCATTANSTVVINQPNQSTTNFSICANNLPYQWNGLSVGAAGLHQVILTNASGCDSVTILNLTVLPVLTSTTNVSICQNQAPYLWNGLSLSTTGTSTVTLTSSLGCDSLATLNLTVNSMPQVSFTANATAGCAPLQVVFTNTSASSGNCQWNLGNGVIINNCGSISGTYENFGCYDVTLQITNAFGCTSSLTQDDIICVEPEPIASFSVNPLIMSMNNPVAQFTNTSSGNSTQIWNFGDNSGGSTQNNPSHTYPEQAGQYYVTLIVANANGCLDSTSQLVIVENDVIYYVPNTFTPDGDKFNPTFKPIFTAGFDVYQYHMIIFNRWGEIIFESYNAEVGWDGTYGGELCSDGVYIWQISYKEIGRDKRNEIRGHVNLLR